MVKVSIEVHSGAARFRVTVRAESIERAMSLVSKRFPGRVVEARFPNVLESLSAEPPARILAA